VLEAEAVGQAEGSGSFPVGGDDAARTSVRAADADPPARRRAGADVVGELSDSGREGGGDHAHQQVLADGEKDVVRAEPGDQVAFDALVAGLQAAGDRDDVRLGQAEAEVLGTFGQAFGPAQKQVVDELAALPFGTAQGGSLGQLVPRERRGAAPSRWI